MRRTRWFGFRRSMNAFALILAFGLSSGMIETTGYFGLTNLALRHVAISPRSMGRPLGDGCVRCLGSFGRARRVEENSSPQRASPAPKLPAGSVVVALLRTFTSAASWLAPAAPVQAPATIHCSSLGALTGGCSPLPDSFLITAIRRTRKKRERASLYDSRGSGSRL